MPIAEDAIGRFLARYAAALSAGDVPVIAASWGVPALVLSERGPLAVSAADDIAMFFSAAVEQYHAQGLAATRPDEVRVEALGEGLASVDVVWANLDAAGAVASSERSRYVLSLEEDGSLRIRVAIALPT